jgi:hypothetical protein
MDQITELFFYRRAHRVSVLNCTHPVTSTYFTPDVSQAGVSYVRMVFALFDEEILTGIIVF